MVHLTIAVHNIKQFMENVKLNLQDCCECHVLVIYKTSETYTVWLFYFTPTSIYRWVDLLSLQKTEL